MSLEQSLSTLMTDFQREREALKQRAGNQIQEMEQVSAPAPTTPVLYKPR